MAQMISHLERVNTNPQQMWMDALKEYKEIEGVLWQMPEGYKARLAPEYLTKVYSSPRPAKVHGELFLKEHGIEQCSAAKGMVDALACIDRLLIEDRAPGLINLVTLEYLARKAYAVEIGFANVRNEKDWRRPSGAKDWVTKVDWDLIYRVDPNMASDAAKGEYLREVREELKAGMARDADFLKLKAKVGERGKPFDPVNS